MEFDQRYAQLNPAQKDAVDTLEGPVLVIAGPGTGKTELLSTRVANILSKTDTPPEAILCLTFTESGAIAMRERLVGIIGKDAYKVAIHTFHSFGTDIISKYREYFYNGAIFSPADDLARYEIIKDIFDGLDYSNPLASKMNGEYVHLSDAQKVISELKRAGGLTSDELLAVLEQDEAVLETAAHDLLPIMAERVSKSMIKKLGDALPKLNALAEETPTLYEVTPLIHIVVHSLKDALSQAEEESSTKPLTNWKKRWISPDEHKQPIFKDKLRLSKLKSLSFIYFEYLQKMERANRYDYDDMILQVVHAMEVQSELRYALQEQYLYIMVDEFQDTNLAQMRLLHNLTDNPVHEGAPNVLAVGDDDQAVYGFQGADVSNIFQFQEQYPSATLITLTDNYRSGKHILDISREVIAQGADRLETRIPELNKQLNAQKTDAGSVSLQEYASVHDERYAVAQAIQSAFKKEEHESIAILGRTHDDIQQMLPYLQHMGLPVRYEKQDDALEQPPIIALEQTARVIIALNNGDHQTVNARLPELLAHPAWNLSAETLWKLSLRAYDSRTHWMEVMATTPELQPIHQWIVERAQEAAFTPLEPMLDTLMGQSDTDGPLFRYFFSPDTLHNNPEQYLEYLSALRVIREKLREHSPTTHPTLHAFIELIDMYRSLGLTMTTPRPTRSTKGRAIDLLTAHKSKGLEFDLVYIIGATDSRWGATARMRPRSISYPENLPLDPAGDTIDERLRLFYVAMTRARQELIITYSTQNDSNKGTLLASFLVSTSITPSPAPEPTVNELLETAHIAWHEPLTVTSRELRDILAPRLETYRLSATAFTRFLNIVHGGPKDFLLNSLLHFPSGTSLALGYGNAVHRALQQAHTHFVAHGEMRPLEDILHDFEVALSFEWLSPTEHVQALKKGSEQLPVFLKSPLVSFTVDQKSELPFAHQEVQYGDARLTGKIDVVTINKNEKRITVSDYKTGKPALNWQGATESEKQKLHQYRQQLLFYKLLLGGSREYAEYDVTQGSLIFVQPTTKGDIRILDLEFAQDEVNRMIALIAAVWEHIQTLNLPDVSAYPTTLRGIQQFEQDLIDGKI